MLPLLPSAGTLAPMRRLADVCYGIMVTAGSPIWLPRMIRTGKHRTDWRGRLGHVPPLPSKSRPRILIHAVSVGEVNAVRYLIDALEEQGDTPPEIILAVTTDTGFARATSLFSDQLTVVRYPLDFSFSVERFLSAVKPDIAVLIELEVWPNFVGSCVRQGISVLVVNGRLTARSHRRYRLIRPLVRPTFARLSFVAAQSEAYAARFRDLGAPAERVSVTGTMKWDTAEIADHVESADTLAQQLGIDRKRPLIVAGSTAPGEHELLHAAAPSSAQLLCAPRKPEWFDQAARAMPGCVRRSQPSVPQTGRPDRFLLDTIGELRQAYALADIVVVGRTFTDLGGSDMMEPIALGKPTVVGPHVSNFQDTVRTLLEGDGLVQTTESELAGLLERLLGDRQRCLQLAEMGRAVIRRNQGASQRHAELILAQLAKVTSRIGPQK